MPINYDEYPPDWADIRQRILKRANNCCEFCGIPNHAIIDRRTRQPCLIDEDMAIQIVLTVAHLDHDHRNMDVKDERLAALCQRCHLNYDRPRHIAKRKYGRLYDGPQQLRLF